jgi:AcrR family transcriptional regulator
MSEDTRGAIREVALELFALHGYQKTSLREIAEKLGITKAALYYHYPSKQALLLAIIEPLLAEWKNVADKAATLTHTKDNVESVLGELLDVLLRHRPIAGMFARDAPAVLEAVGTLYEEIFELSQRFQAWLAGPDATAVDRIRAMAATETLGTALGWAPSMGDISDDDMRAVLLECAAAVLRLDDPAHTPRR